MKDTADQSLTINYVVHRPTPKRVYNADALIFSIVALLPLIGSLMALLSQRTAEVAAGVFLLCSIASVLLSLFSFLYSLLLIGTSRDFGVNLAFAGVCVSGGWLAVVSFLILLYA